MRHAEHTVVRRASLTVYFLLAFAISWAAWWAMVVFRIQGAAAAPGQTGPSGLGLALLALGGTAPLIAGVLETARSNGRAGLRDLWRRCTAWRIGGRAWMVVVLVPAALAGERLLVQVLRGGTLVLPVPLARPELLAGFIVQMFLFGPVSEEPGWRGVALDRMLERWGGLRASLALGAVHALWHVPLFFVPGTVQQLWGRPLVEFPVFALNGLGQAVIFTWLHLATRRSVWAAILFHFTVNCASTLIWLSYDGDLIDRLAGALAAVAAGAVLMVLNRLSRLWRESSAS
jgi:membrane protease YdiL (CAAX protease family)